MSPLKITCLLLILVVTLLSGAYPFIKKYKTKQHVKFPIGESLAAGIFLGAGLIHMLGDASRDFYAAHVAYPLAFLLAGAMLILLLLLEHIAGEMYHHKGTASNSFAVLSVVMLSIHSFLAGAALGLTGSVAVTLVILLAIMGHKWAASFALSIQINKSNLCLKHSILLFLIFSLMTPLGIIIGSFTLHSLQLYPLIEPIFMSLAAGTFLYLGTLHGLEQSILVKQCCNLKMFCYVVLGFVIMAVVAIWT